VFADPAQVHDKPEALDDLHVLDCSNGHFAALHRLDPR
jgi:hypothetical protein